MYDVYGIDNDDFWFNWTTEFSDNYTFYYYLLNETDYEWDNITIWDNWLTLLVLVLVYSLDVGLRRLTGLT